MEIGIEKMKKLRRETEELKRRRDKAISAIEEIERMKTTKKIEKDKTTSTTTPQKQKQNYIHFAKKEVKTTIKKMVFSKAGASILSIFSPYLVGLLSVILICLVVIDVSFDTYIKLIKEHFSFVGIWTIGYFLITSTALLIIISKLLKQSIEEKVKAKKEFHTYTHRA